ncbi:MAG: VacJ family lipoprotein [Campylobacterota bacterium]|nr:VacJ family lipoprotein [Campylobacterota bacterium]
MRLWYLLSIILIVLSGCSSKNIDQPDKTLQYQEKILTVDEDDELFDEFEDETESEDIYDPLSGYNRFMTGFNDGLYEYFLTPIAKGYNVIVHEEIRKSVAKFFHNLYYPPRLVNNLLQGKFKNASEETGRFIINSTIGILGLFDPAKSQFDLEVHEEDFGQTLGFYGVGAGPHIVLPLWGPSNLRDFVGIFPDAALSPIDYTQRDWITITDNWEAFLAVKAYEKVNKFSLNIDKYEKLKEDSVDLYPYLRDIYEQYREKQIKE